MKRRNLHTLALGLIIAMVITTSAFAANPCNPCAAKKGHFMVNDNRNVFTFESKAPLEKIIGTTSGIIGHIHLDPKDITKKPMVKFEVDLASLKTGIELRDEHMRDNFLETAKYPKATLTVQKLANVSQKALMNMKPITFDAEGTLELHGVKKPVVIKGIQVTYFKESDDTKAKMPGDLIHIEAGFSIKLPDYQVKVPQKLFLKLDENIKINVDLFASNAMAGANPCNPCAANPCNPCAAKKASNPCNPCAAKKASNPCNPCAAKKASNPCNPCAKKAEKK